MYSRLIFLSLTALESRLMGSTDPRLSAHVEHHHTHWPPVAAPSLHFLQVGRLSVMEKNRENLSSMAITALNQGRVSQADKRPRDVHPYPIGDTRLILHCVATFPTPIGE